MVFSKNHSKPQNQSSTIHHDVQMKWQWTCIALVAQTLLSLSVTIVARLSFMGDAITPFQPNVVLLLTSVLKLFLSILAITLTKQKKIKKTSPSSKSSPSSPSSSPLLPPHTSLTTSILTRDKTREKTRETIVVPLYCYGFPALMYCVSNAIIFHTVGVISPGEFVLLWQSKIASTALLYRFVLHRSVRRIFVFMCP